MTHLGRTMSHAAAMRGLDVERSDFAGCDLVIVTLDVENNEDDLERLFVFLHDVLDCVPGVPVVLMSQVPPGFTRPWLKKHPNLWYQVDTLIMNCALERALNPERHIIGCADPTASLPIAYQRYLGAFPAPILRMSIEAAEVTKLAINFMLAAQISAANTLASVAKKFGADWAEISPALRLDKRIGHHAYIEPGVIGGHLPRDVIRVSDLAGSMFARSIGPLAA